MSAPSVVDTYPANSDTGIPVGATLLVYFDKGVELQTVKDSIVLYGADRDITSGPDSAMWMDSFTGSDPFYLTSPGFQGVVPVVIELAYYTLGTTTEADPGTITGEADETSANVGHVAKITVDPNYSATLAPDLTYQWHIIGDPSSQGVGVSARTVFDVEAGGSNTGDGGMLSSGPYSGSTADTLHVKITKAGDIGTAKYKWWYDSAGEVSAVIGRVTSPRYRSLDNGLKVRFTGSDFDVNDEYTFDVEPFERLATSTIVSFTTNDGTYTAAPDSPSTPATSSPPSTSLPTNASAGFTVDEMFPIHGSYNVDPNNRIITITFTDDVDASTITDDSIKLWKYPVSGEYSDTFAPVELQKVLTVSGNTVTIEY